MLTIRDVIDFVSKGENFYFYCSAFLDEFYSADDEIRKQMIIDEPDPFDHVAHFYYCHVAAIAHKLANDYQLPVPKWVHKKDYILDEPYYYLDTKNEILREHFRKASPHEFKIRNIFVDSNTIDRV